MTKGLLNDDGKNDTLKSKKITILSPVCGEKAIFEWPTIWNGIETGYEILSVIKCVFDDDSDFDSQMIENISLNAIDATDFQQVTKVVKRYNSIIREKLSLLAGTAYQMDIRKKKIGIPLLKFILEQCYNSSVSDSRKLNLYKPGSSGVYGETSFDFFVDVIKYVERRLNKSCRFVDIGSGIGNIVCLTAALMDIQRSYGIEIEHYPAECARKYVNTFQFWMKFYGKRHSFIDINQGDVREPKFHSMLSSCNFIFTNNVKFHPELNNFLSSIFMKCADNTLILSPVSFIGKNFRVSNRTIDSLSARMICENVIEGNVSWMSQKCSYFVQEINYAHYQKQLVRLQEENSQQLKPKRIRTSSQFDEMNQMELEVNDENKIPISLRNDSVIKEEKMIFSTTLTQPKTVSISTESNKNESISKESNKNESNKTVSISKESNKNESSKTVSISKESNKKNRIIKKKKPIVMNKDGSKSKENIDEKTEKQKKKKDKQISDMLNAMERASKSAAKKQLDLSNYSLFNNDELVPDNISSPNIIYSSKLIDNYDDSDENLMMSNCSYISEKLINAEALKAAEKAFHKKKKSLMSDKKKKKKKSKNSLSWNEILNECNVQTIRKEREVKDSHRAL
ncbi:hypothetical protein SNEBB_006829 [Seison nebaliae]|nr:hypothetical protein SNEBB_006829 [Seison nebaliae]